MSAVRAHVDGETERATLAYRAYLDHLMDCDRCAKLSVRCPKGKRLYASHRDTRRSA
jgi:hypothetical protein